MIQFSLLADFPEWVATIAHWYWEEWGYLSPNLSKEKFFKQVSAKAENRDTLPLAIIAHKEKQIIGVIELKKHENKDYLEYEDWLGGIYVMPKYRGQSIAGHLLLNAIEKAKQLDIDRLYLQCESHNVQLYEKYGFTKLHQAKYHKVETTIMCRSSRT